MKKKEPPIEKYPGNAWLAARLDEYNIKDTVPFVQGIIRGSVANPMMVELEPAEVIAEIFDKKKADRMSVADLETMFMGILGLWCETVISLQVPTEYRDRFCQLYV